MQLQPDKVSFVESAVVAMVKKSVKLVKWVSNVQAFAQKYQKKDLARALWVEVQATLKTLSRNTVNIVKFVLRQKPRNNCTIRLDSEVDETGPRIERFIKDLDEK